jgi:NAD(P)-dependent dehydrogenase (short-subunit alcohol dehydrogenase family)
MADEARAVLITGCSSGIGRATAERLLAGGWRVYATARRPETVADLADRGAVTLPLDVTDEDSMAAAVRHVESADGGIDALVNNAGYGLYGPVETTSMTEVRRQFETNFFGLVRLTQLALPGMRRAGRGRIVNVSSMGGRITMPGGGFYHASKHAVEALSDVLRFEVRGFGVHVVVVEPGTVRTPWIDTAVETAPAPDADDPYGPFTSSLTDRIRRGYEGPLARLASSPERVAAVIERALRARRPRARYVVGPVARTLITSRAVLPDRGWDAAMRIYYR